MKKSKGRRGRREYYDPGKTPKPRAIIRGRKHEAVVAKETRQLRRAKERANSELEFCAVCSLTRRDHDGTELHRFKVREAAI